MDLAGEIAKVSTDLSNMQTELNQIRSKAAPFISEFGQQMSSNPGPGAYSHKEDFGKQSYQSYKPNPKIFSFDKSKKAVSYTHLTLPTNREV